MFNPKKTESNVRWELYPFSEIDISKGYVYPSNYNIPPIVLKCISALIYTSGDIFVSNIENFNKTFNVSDIVIKEKSFIYNLIKKKAYLYMFTSIPYCIKDELGLKDIELNFRIGKVSFSNDIILQWVIMIQHKTSVTHTLILPYTGYNKEYKFEFTKKFMALENLATRM